MEAIRLSISARYKDFKNSLDEFLFDHYRNNKKAEEYFEGQGKFKLQYPFLGALILYGITVLDNNNLDIEISVPMSANENSEIHLRDVVEHIKKNFPSATIPVGFRNLILDEKYAEIMENRWKESEKTEIAEAWLATIVILGSILEGLLLYKIKSDNETSNRVYKEIFGTTKPYKDWTLEAMIMVCHKSNWISRDVKGFSDGVKEYRNFVHPWKQLENNLDMPTSQSCNISRDVVKIVLDELWRNN